jgi:peptidoglycan hydrolase CwlO-like protein
MAQPNYQRLASGLASASEECARFANVVTNQQSQNLTDALNGLRQDLHGIRGEINTIRNDINTMRNDITSLRTEFTTFRTEITSRLDAR